MGGSMVDDECMKGAVVQLIADQYMRKECSMQRELNRRRSKYIYQPYDALALRSS